MCLPESSCSPLVLLPKIWSICLYTKAYKVVEYNIRMAFRDPGPRGKPIKIRTFALFGLFGAAVVAALYPIYFYPKMHEKEYREYQKAIRLKEGIKQEEIQPGNMNIWKDPFGRK